MKATLKASGLGAVMGFLFLCSCATQTPIRRALPAPVTINEDAGRGGPLLVTLTLENGKELLFDVDTGSPVTVLSKSLEPLLGRRLGQSSLNWWNGPEKSDVYAAPKLYLGGIRLPTAGFIFTSDHLNGKESHTMGVLGMDCLRHYCLQLDFAARKMYFLGSNRGDVAGPGRAFPLTLSSINGQSRFIRPIIHHAGLVGDNSDTLIDTGCRIDGLGSESAIRGMAVFLPECVWADENFTNLIIANVDRAHANALGLSFLARHLVTLDFLNRMMYLKQTSTGPLAGDILQEIAHSDHRAIFEACERLKAGGQLPGLAKNDQGEVYFETYSSTGGESVTFGFRKNGDRSTNHYQARRKSKENPWQLQKAWRTDVNGHVVEEYPAAP